MNTTISRLIIACCLVFSATGATASNYFYCTKGSGYVTLGDAVTKVDQLCGKPTQTEMINLKTAASSSDTTRWFYAQMRQGTTGRYSETIGQESFLIDFQNGVVKTLTVNGQKVTSTTLCSRITPVAIGDSSAQVWRTCGSPRYKRLYRSNQKASATPEQAIVYIYQSLSGTTTLTFRQLKLVEIAP